MSHVKFYDLSPKTQSFQENIQVGFQKKQKSISPKYFYDHQGSILFDKICTLPEYYITRTENTILKENKREILSYINPDSLFIEYGSGASEKTQIFLKELPNLKAYVPIEISKDYLRETAQKLSEQFKIPIYAVCADFTSITKLPFDSTSQDTLFFPGSTLGNFDTQSQVNLLTNISNLLGSGNQLLVGIDLKKDVSILKNAYDDSKGVTKDFNLNLLNRINQEAYGEFDLNTFNHEVIFNSEESRIEMHLVSQTDQEVQIGKQIFKFNKGESIHTENSYKFSWEKIKNLAQKSGMKITKTWTDRNDYFAVILLTVN